LAADRKQSEKLHRERIEPAELKPQYNGRGPAEVVPGFQLSTVLREWIVRYLDGRGISESKLVGDEVAMFGPIQYLSHWTGISVRRVSGICNGEFPNVPYQQAEILLMVIDRDYLLANGEIQVVPNPNWSLEKWMDYMRERGCV
jgi:hypothetical protein